jgi:hypothetical protein
LPGSVLLPFPFPIVHMAGQQSVTEMFDWLFVAFGSIFEFVAAAYEVDPAPAARQMATGCFGILLGLVVLGFLTRSLIQMLGW